MSNNFFRFRQFTIWQDKCAMKVTSLACIQGAWLPDIAPRRVLDIGAGTGLLTLMAAEKYESHFDAVEIDALAYEQMTGNIAKSPWHRNITCHHNDIRDFAKQNSRTYDLIITNPPFFTNQLKSPDERINLARHEDGLTMEKLVEICASLIKPDGVISILLPLPETVTMLSYAASFSLRPIKKLTIFDRPYKSPLSSVTLLSKTDNIPQSEQLVIKDHTGSYSAQFKSLMGAYYLNL